MKWSRHILIFAMIGALVLGTQYSFAVPSLVISTSKHVYEYGDLLSINVQVSELVSNSITIHITDSSNKTSAPINLPIYKLNNTITSPFPFYKTTFNPGTYRIDAKYSNSTASVSFDLIDTGKIVIPIEFKSLVKTLEQGSPTDKMYAGVIRELINNNILNVPNYNPTNQTYVPQWFKNNVKWWSNDSISDNEFGMSIEYLIQKGIIQV
ncbi:hypothetical protein [Candidatus Nitrosotalea okcheonensis]|uniref:Secreted periplasmic Zn-dependent protease n=1 Tax=Candidatus Nitrosotalea okcheonensis TaxID=1903276 RepID=A0A2H1FFJ6_9ARCH|nr:hypothetical protein [Candidatus Nitrosotalea okcheonensis]SMH71527.1 conserved exported protein of unknown function [Candidatus Nitrosotalea okcheonensis]